MKKYTEWCVVVKLVNSPIFIAEVRTGTTGRQDLSWGLIRTREAAFLSQTALDSAALVAKQIQSITDWVVSLFSSYNRLYMFEPN